MTLHPHCPVCCHPDREQIDSLHPLTTSVSSLAPQFHLSPAALLNHLSHHIPHPAAPQSAPPQPGQILLHALELFHHSAPSFATLLHPRWHNRALNLQRQALEFAARFQQQLLKTGSAFPPLTQSPEWWDLRTVILDALDLFPDAKSHLAQICDQEPGQ